MNITNAVDVRTQAVSPVLIFNAHPRVVSGRTFSRECFSAVARLLRACERTVFDGGAQR